MLWRPPTFPDDRGKPATAVKLADIKNAEGRGVRGGPLTRYLRRLVTAERQRQFGFKDIIKILFLVASPFLIYKIVHYYSFSFQYQFAVYSVVYIVGIYVLEWLFGDGSGRGVAAAAVADGYCGSCGYSLKALEQCDDGCVVCPECGAAWFRSRIIQPHWEGEREPVSLDSPRMMPDDRGRYVRVLDSFLGPLPADRRDAIGRDEIRRISARIRRRGRTKRFLAMLTLLVVASVSCVVGIVMWIDGGEIALFPLLCFIVTLLFILFGIGVYRSSMFVKADIICAMMKSEGLCAVCASSLEGLTTESDGCVVCSRCKAAWRLERPNPGDQPETA